MQIPSMNKIGRKRRNELREFRIEMELPVPKHGRVECLMCGKRFKSVDMVKIRRCPACRSILKERERRGWL